MLDGFSNGEGFLLFSLTAGRGGGGGVGIPCPLLSRPPPLPQPFQPSPTPRGTKSPSFWGGAPSLLGPGPKPLEAPAPSRGPKSLGARLLAPLDFLRAVPPKNIVPVIVTSEDSASRVTSITVRSPPEAHTHLPAASSRRASVSQVWPVGRRTEPEAL